MTQTVEAPRRGPGRPKGAKTKNRSVESQLQRVALAESQTRKAVGQWAIKGDILPIDVMLEAMKVAYEEQGPIAAFPYAEKLAPYFHAKKLAIAASVVPRNAEIQGWFLQPIKSVIEGEAVEVAGAG